MDRKLRVGIFDTEYYTYNHYILQGIRAAFARDPRVHSARLIHFHTSLDDMLAQDLDLLLVVGNAVNVHWQVPRWRAMGVTTVFWSTEDPYQLSENVAYSKAFDLVFSNDLAALPVYGARARHLPLAGITETHLCDVRPDAELRSDLLFIGSAWPNRVEAFNQLREMLGDDIRIKVALPANPHIPKPQLTDSSLIWNWRTSPGGFARLANRSRVVLTLGRTFSGVSGVAYGSTPPPRIFELGLAGTAQVFVAQSREIDRYYEDGRDLITRATMAEAAEEIRGLLAAPDRREAMARSIREATLARHRYENRAAEILTAALEIRAPGAVQMAPSETAAGTGSGLPARSRRPRLLIVVHNTLDRGAGGGVEVYHDASLRLLQQHYDVYILQPENRSGRLVLELRRPDGINLRHETPFAFGSDHISQPAIESFLFQTILRYRIDLVHFHHLLHLPLTLPQVARLAGARTLFTAHDYYLVCDNFSLISHERHYCDFRNRSASFCDLCLRLTKGHEPGAQAVRRNAVQRALATLDKVIFNTPYSRDLFLDTYRLAPEQPEIVEMTMPTRHVRATAHPERPADGHEGGADFAARVLKVKIPGNFTREKGAFELLEVLSMLRNAPIEFHILGREDDAVAARLDALDNPRIRRERGYQQPDLAELLADGDVSINFSIWPETYMISLSEAWSAGLIPIVSDLGAPAERVTHGVDGFVIPAGDIGRLAEHLAELADDPGTRRRMRGTILDKRILRMSDHVEQLRGLYDALVAETPEQVELDGGDRLIFHRQMYSDRAPNNVWTDPSVAWDAAADSANIRLANPYVLPLGYPVTDLPIIYRHLPRKEIAGSAVVLENATPREDEFNRQFCDLTYRLYPKATVENLENFLMLETPESRLVYALRRQVAANGSLLLSGSVPVTGPVRKMALLSVYIDEVTVCETLEAPAPLELQDGGPGEAPPLALVPARSFDPVQGCDRIIRAENSDGMLQVEGWAFDPQTGGIPTTVLIEVGDGAGRVVALEAVRQGDASVTRQAPMLGFSGIRAEVPIDRLTAILPKAAEALQLRIVQVSAAGNWISSGTHVTLPLSGTDARMQRRISEPLLAAVLTALKTQGQRGDEAIRSAELLTWTIDPRLYADRAGGRKRVAGNALISHYLAEGEAAGDIPVVGFDPTVYAAANPELAGLRPLLLHYLKFGRHEGRIAWSGAGVGSPDADRIRPHIRKDDYVRRLFGGATFSGDVAMHYLAFGEPNDFRPNESFDPAYYRRANPDVARSGMSPFVHYLKFGRNEGRRPAEHAPLQSPHADKRSLVEPFFDMAYYAAQVPYITGTDIDPICHYFEHGIPNNLMPSRAYAAERSHIFAASELERFLRWCAEQDSAGEQVE